MSNDELKALPPRQGYLNFDELKSTLLHGLGAGSLTAFGLSLSVLILDNMSKIYIGPSAAIVISAASAIAAILRSFQAGVKYLHEGDEL